MKLFKRLFVRRMPESDLARESVKAANYYIEKTCPGLGMVDKQNTLNHVARGFGMAVRWYEEELGVTRDRTE